MNNRSKKILNKENLLKIIKFYKLKNKRIVLCHGTFDLLHLGHLKYFESAKQKGDILIISVTASKYVKKGLNRPIHSDDERLNALSFIETVDHIFLDQNFNAVNVIKLIRPNFFVKGKDYLKSEDKNLIEEKKAIKIVNGKFIITNDALYSSSSILNKTQLPDNLNKKISEIKKNNKLKNINNIFSQFKKLKVLLIGETIFDKYIYTDYLGKPSKENIIATLYQKETLTPGGVIGTYRALKALDINAECLTVINKNSKSIIRKVDKSLINSKSVFFSQNEDLVKTRFINKSHYKISKLFEIYNIKNLVLKFKIKKEIINFLKKNKNKYDLIIVNDYGHGLIDKDLIKELSSTKKFVSVNTQINAGNFGFNLITKYKKANLICLNKNEIQLASRINSDDFDEIIKELKKTVKCNLWLVTLGSKGSLIKSKNKKIVKFEAVSNKVLDTISAGDIFFAIASIIWFSTKSEKLTLLLSNLAGNIAANVETPSTFIDSYTFKKYIETIFK